LKCRSANCPKRPARLLRGAERGEAVKSATETVKKLGNASERDAIVEELTDAARRRPDYESAGLASARVQSILIPRKPEGL
jgi:hypothetical protein